jgi:hypothetical protein
MQAQGLTKVGMKDSAPIVNVLCGERSVEAVGVAERGDVGSGCALAKHLDDGIAGDKVDQKKDDRDHHPEDREGDEDAADGFGDGRQVYVVRSTLSSAVRFRY